MLIGGRVVVPWPQLKGKERREWFTHIQTHELNAGGQVCRTRASFGYWKHDFPTCGVTKREDSAAIEPFLDSDSTVRKADGLSLSCKRLCKSE